MPPKNPYLQLPRPSLVRELTAAICFCLVATSPLWAFDWLAENRATIEKMSPAEKADLDDKYQRFLLLPPATQDKLRLLQQQLNSDPNGERLRHVMQRYYDWLQKSLNPAQRAELAELAAKPSDTERLTMIERLRQDQEAQAAGSHMTGADMAAITEWMKKYAADHESELRREFPHWHSPSANSGSNSHRSVQGHAGVLWIRDRLPPISPKEIDDLAAKLSQKPRAAINSQATYQAKEKLVQGWLQAIARTRFARQGSNLNAAKLTEYFRTLPKNEQTRLLEISDPERRRHELLRDYNEAHPRAGRMRSDSDGEVGGTHFDGPEHSGPPHGKHFEPDASTPAGPKPNKTDNPDQN
jgi:hypothetical protein